MCGRWPWDRDRNRPEFSFIAKSNSASGWIVVMKRIIEKTISAICLAGLIGFALGFLKHLGRPLGYQLPWIPNVFDSAFIIFAAVWLGYQVRKTYRPPTKTLTGYAENLCRGYGKRSKPK